MRLIGGHVISSRFDSFKRQIATLCGALMMFSVGQAGTAAADEVQHHLGLDHAANPAAGLLIEFTASQDHHDDADMSGDDDDADGSDGPTGHQHADTPAAVHLLAGPGPEPAPVQLISLVAERGLTRCGVGCRGPDHPPKA